jgi:hypothetical protein
VAIVVFSSIVIVNPLAKAVSPTPGLVPVCHIAGFEKFPLAIAMIAGIINYSLLFKVA